MSTQRRCEECWAVLDPTKVLRCTKCKACFYCSAACQKRNWRLHKRVCTTDPSLRRFVPVEMAVERALAKQPKMAKAPKDATCYICLEGEDGGKLMRGCACRGDSAGFVHLECLTELAMSKEASGDSNNDVFNSWTSCGNCKQRFTGALDLEMGRRFWRRRYRSDENWGLRYHATKSLATRLAYDDEVDAACQLLDDASTCVGTNEHARVDVNIIRAKMLSKHDRGLEAHELMNATLPEAKKYTAVYPNLYYDAMNTMVVVLGHLGRYQESLDTATELVAYSKEKYGPERDRTLSARGLYASICGHLGRFEESQCIYEDLLRTETRIYGRDHPATVNTRQHMLSIQTRGFTAASPTA